MIKLKELLRLEQRREEKQEEPKNKKVVVVMNIVDHMSLVNAMLFSMIYQESSPSDTVVCVDIREVIPEDGDQYYWVEVGGYQDFLDYYSDAGRGYVFLSKENKDWLEKLSTCSVFVNGERSRHELENPGETTQSLLLNLLPICEHSGRRSSILMANAYTGLSWLTDKISDLGACQYYNVLQNLYARHQGTEVSLDLLEKLSYYGEKSSPVRWQSLLQGKNASMEGAMLENYVESQQRISPLITQRQRSIILDNKCFLYMNDLSKVVYSSIRRASLSNKNFIHVSEGSYGRVIFTNTVGTDIHDYVQKGTFLLRR